MTDPAGADLGAGQVEGSNSIIRTAGEEETTENSSGKKRITRVIESEQI